MDFVRKVTADFTSEEIKAIESIICLTEKFSKICNDECGDCPFKNLCNSLFNGDCYGITEKTNRLIELMEEKYGE